jgi:hypothetical protein
MPILAKPGIGILLSGGERTMHSVFFSPRQWLPRLFLCVTGVALVLLFGGEAAESASNLATPVDRAPVYISAAMQVQCLDAGKATTATHAQTGKLRFVGTEPSAPLARRAATPLLKYA